QQTAINNAKRLVTKHISDYGEINVEQNPITMIYQLVECLNLNLEEKQCDCFPN
ncbi:MAG: hypothetical protein QG567_810, partial [Campylobacterota bacterium]|nr:hypothetical protein [Campylobacterota bacterium]